MSNHQIYCGFHIETTEANQYLISLADLDGGRAPLAVINMRKYKIRTKYSNVIIKLHAFTSIRVKAT